MVCRLRSNDAVKRSCANVSGTVSIDVLIAGVAAVVAAVVVLDVVIFIVVIGALDVLRLTILAQDIVSSVFRCAEDCLHCILLHAWV